MKFCHLKFACPNPGKPFPPRQNPFYFTCDSFGTSSIGIYPETMSPDSIVQLTAAISISLCFLEPAMPDMRAAQSLQELHIRQFDELITGCRLILEACGRPQFLNSLFVLWSQLSQALYLLERTLWPEQRPDTPLHLQLPNAPRPLGELLLDAFTPNMQSIYNAINALTTFHTWFSDSYSVELHSDFNSVLEDSLLIFRSVETPLRLKNRIIANAPRGPAIDLDPPEATGASTADHATASTTAADPAPAEGPMELQSETGAPLQWF